MNEGKKWNSISFRCCATGREIFRMHNTWRNGRRGDGDGECEKKKIQMQKSSEWCANEQQQQQQQWNFRHWTVESQRNNYTSGGRGWQRDGKYNFFLNCILPSGESLRLRRRNVTAEWVFCFFSFRNQRRIKILIPNEMDTKQSEQDFQFNTNYHDKYYSHRLRSHNVWTALDWIGLKTTHNETIE